MPIYQSPGVYVEEVPGTPPIVGVGTSTAGFIGLIPDNVEMPPEPGQFEVELVNGQPKKDDNGNTVYKKDAKGNPIPIKFKVAPKEEPQLITSWEQFKNKFGDFQTKANADNKLAHAAYGFFNNGGKTCYVSRVTTLDAAAAKNNLKKFEAIDEIAIVAIPGATAKDVLTEVVNHCENLKDRFAILDSQDTSNPATIEISVKKITGDLSISNYAALYFPWIKVFDPATGKRLSIPPSGHLAGIYARVDQERGVHKAPANEVVRGALELDYRASKNEQDILNPRGINVIREINVRRLLNFLRESIDESTQFVVFEPNNPKLWEKIKRAVTAFLTNVWRDGALFGNTPEEAFYVKCDEMTNPPEVIELGQVITEIGVRIVKPAEFVIFRITQLTGQEG
jgi:phage tail sheath protein FI